MRFHVTLAALVVAAALVGCNSQPILNTSNPGITNAAGKPLSRDQVRGAIVRAGAALGWNMKDDASGNALVGTIALRTHSAVVEIPYSANSYSIKYKSSVGLDEKGGGTIHKNYNGWITNLQRGINAQLSAS